MSAICGIVHFDGKPADKGELETMVESSPYRGPDGTGYHLEGNAGFAHLAFHVTPESVHEKQPLVSDDGRFVLCVDARLDNRDELLQKLDVRPRDARVVTDPDLVLAAWLRWGAACVEQLLGDFVFSVWDTRERSLFLARDPLGGYCVHYHRAGDAFVFASAISAILDLPFVNPVINEARVLRQIEFLPCNQQETFFESVHYLPPAHCLEIKSGTVRQWRYWDVDPERRIDYGDDQEYADHLLELVQQATADRMRSIGPVGISLSGGYDSTLIAACGARSLPNLPGGQQRLLSFSYVFPQLEECDESAFIDPVVAQYDLDAQAVIADRKWSFRDLESQPIERDHLWINPFRQLPDAIAAAARERSCRVLLDGQYGDPLFAGTNLNLADLLSRWKLGGAVAYIARNRAHLRWRHDVLGGGIMPLVPGRLRRLYRQLRPARNQALIGGLQEDKLSLLGQLRQEEATNDGPALAEPGRRRRYRSLMSWAWPQGLAAGRGPPAAGTAARRPPAARRRPGRIPPGTPGNRCARGP